MNVVRLAEDASLEARPPAEPRHVVQFYEDEEFLYDVVARFIGAGLAAGESVIVIATDAHRQAFGRHLASNGFDVGGACASGRLAMLDASETLARFMVDGVPAGDRFEGVIGRAIERGIAATNGGHVRAYGEMVDFSLLCAYAMHTEIAYRKRVEAELRRARADAESANRHKDECLATLSHELRTPLTAILGWAQILRTGRFDTSRLARAIDAIERNAKLQAQLIEDVLDVSSVVAGKLRLRMRQMDLTGVVHAAVDTVRPLADAKSIALSVELGAEACSVAGDADRLQQVLWNLLTNAIKFTPAQGRIGVRLDRWQSFARVSVTDTGQGIAADFLSQVFDRFRQADASPSRQHGGLGLGLSIVRHLIALHGGQVHAESDGVGMGARFSVCVPLLAASGAEEAPSGQTLAGLPQRAAASLAGVRVLVVDDDPDAREVLSMILVEEGALVSVAGSARQALSELQKWAPHVMVSDIGMPVEDGYDLIRQARALPLQSGGGVPAIALTAYATAEDCRRAIAAGFQVHVPKPVVPERLIHIIARLCRGLAEEEARRA